MDEKTLNILKNFGANKDRDDLIKHASKLFRDHFKSEPIVCGVAPGRVNLIGEHVDYNDGFVLPVAIPYFTVVIGRKNNSDQCNIFSACSTLDESQEVIFAIPKDSESISNMVPEKPTWANYVKGVIVNYKGKLSGFDALISSTVPVGVGLSSSAALEVSTYFFLEELEGCVFEGRTCSIDKALACQKAEHDFLGMPCGIMDQFISCLGSFGHAMLLDCRSLEYHNYILQPTILITSTNVRHKLAESQYAKRKEECERAAKIIGKTSLRDITIEEVQEYKERLGDVYPRALHVVGEIKRTIDAARALNEMDYITFGKLMIQSHESLRDNYEVSCAELDIVVKAALEVDGVFGSRMTGGGFGGCTVTLLMDHSLKAAVDNIRKNYEKASFYTCHPCDGAFSILF